MLVGGGLVGGVYLFQKKANEPRSINDLHPQDRDKGSHTNNIETKMTRFHANHSGDANPISAATIPNARVTSRGTNEEGKPHSAH